MISADERFATKLCCEFCLLDARNVRELFMEQAEEEYSPFLEYLAAYMTECPWNLS